MQGSNASSLQRGHFSDSYTSPIFFHKGLSKKMEDERVILDHLKSKSITPIHKRILHKAKRYYKKNFKNEEVSKSGARTNKRNQHKAQNYYNRKEREKIVKLFNNNEAKHDLEHIKRYILKNKTPVLAAPTNVSANIPVTSSSKPIEISATGPINVSAEPANIPVTSVLVTSPTTRSRKQIIESKQTAKPVITQKVVKEKNRSTRRTQKVVKEKNRSTKGTQKLVKEINRRFVERANQQRVQRRDQIVQSEVERAKQQRTQRRDQIARSEVTVVAPPQPKMNRSKQLNANSHLNNPPTHKLYSDSNNGLKRQRQFNSTPPERKIPHKFDKLRSLLEKQGKPSVKNLFVAKESDRLSSNASTAQIAEYLIEHHLNGDTQHLREFKQLGHGKSGYVFNYRQYVVKFASQDGINSLKHEIDVLSHFNHPHIIQMLQSGEYKNVPYIVQPYLKDYISLDMVNVAELERKHKIDVRDQIGEVLNIIHKAGYAHYNLIFKNIMYNPLTKQICIIEFMNACFETCFQFNDALKTNPAYPPYYGVAKLNLSNGIRADNYFFAVVNVYILSGGTVNPNSCNTRSDYMNAVKTFLSTVKTNKSYIIALFILSVIHNEERNVYDALDKPIEATGNPPGKRKPKNFAKSAERMEYQEYSPKVKGVIKADFEATNELRLLSPFIKCVAIIAYARARIAKRTACDIPGLEVSMADIYLVWSSYQNAAKEAYDQSLPLRERVARVVQTVLTKSRVYKYETDAANFLYKLTFDGTQNCVSGTLLMYTLLKCCDSTIDVRFALMTGHVLLAFYDNDTEIFLETATKQTSILSRNEVEQLHNKTVFVCPKEHPTGMTQVCEYLINMVSNLDEYDDNLIFQCIPLLMRYNLQHSDDLNVKLFTNLCLRRCVSNMSIKPYDCVQCIYTTLNKSLWTNKNKCLYTICLTSFLHILDFIRPDSLLNEFKHFRNVVVNQTLLKIHKMLIDIERTIRIHRRSYHAKSDCSTQYEQNTQMSRSLSVQTLPNLPTPAVSRRSSQSLSTSKTVSEKTHIGASMEHHAVKPKFIGSAPVRKNAKDKQKRLSSPRRVLHKLLPLKERMRMDAHLTHKSRYLYKFNANNFSSPFIACVAIIACARFELEGWDYGMYDIIKEWNMYINIAKRAYTQYSTRINTNSVQESTPHSVRVLEVWKTIKNNITNVQRNSNDKTKYLIKNDIAFDSNSDNFLYDLVLNKSCNCACGTTMVFELIKIVDKEVDIRIVFSQDHVLLAVVDSDEHIWILETVGAADNLILLSQNDYETKYQRLLIISPKMHPRGMVNFCTFLIQMLRKREHALTFDDTMITKCAIFIKRYGLHRSDNPPEIALFSNLCLRYTMHNGVYIKPYECVNAILKSMKALVSVWKHVEGCLYFKNLKQFTIIDKILLPDSLTEDFKSLKSMHVNQTIRNIKVYIQDLLEDVYFHQQRAHGGVDCCFVTNLL